MADSDGSASKGNRTASTDDGYCSICMRQFKDMRGLTLHKKIFHEEEYHKDRAKEISSGQAHLHKLRWSDEESHEMAEEEAKSTRQKIRYMNDHLFGVFPHRTYDAIKGKRRQVGYKRLVQEKIANLPTLMEDGNENERQAVKNGKKTKEKDDEKRTKMRKQTKKMMMIKIKTKTMMTKMMKTMMTTLTYPLLL